MTIVLHRLHPRPIFVFFFNDTATTEIYTLSLHDALPIFHLLAAAARAHRARAPRQDRRRHLPAYPGDRKSTRLNSSHSQISYAVFCLKKKTKIPMPHPLCKHPNSSVLLAHTTTSCTRSSH